MIEAVLDTNVLVSGIVGYANEQSTPGELLRRWQDNEYSLIVSAHILAELARALDDPYVTRRMRPDQIASALLAVRTGAMVQPITVLVHGVATEPEDDLVLATAVSAGAAYLVTGDRPLQAIGQYEGVTMLSPRQFLDLLLAEE